MTDRLLFAIIGGFAVMILIALVLVVQNLYRNEDRLLSFQRQCATAGGHPYGTGLTLCLTPDGRVIEVYP